MDHAKLWEIIIAAILGGLATAWLLPVIGFLLLSNRNRNRIIVEPGPPVKEPGEGYWDFPIRIINTSDSTLRNVVAFITVEYDEPDLREDPGILIDKTLIAGRPLVISWAGHADKEDKHIMHIKEGAEGILNAFRRHQTGDQAPLLQVASEYGFSNVFGKRPGSLLLNGAKDYDFVITVIGDNLLPIVERYKFDLFTAGVLETSHSSGPADREPGITDPSPLGEVCCR